MLADAGELMTPPTQPEVREFRRWLCEEVLGQAVGAGPRPWSADRMAHARPPGPESPPQWDVDQVSDSTAAVLAADDANRIVAVSATMASALGYRAPEELVGERLVTVVPERYRQAHIAGFTLHLTTGRDALLGTPVTLPVLHADGSEHEHTLVVQAHVLPLGRRLFTAEVIG